MNSLFSLRSGSPQKEVLKLMEYDKNTWQSGDTITAAKLNNIENALAALAAAQAPLETNVTTAEDSETGKVTITTDKTAGEVFDAVNQGKMVRALISISTGNGEESVTLMLTKTVRIAGVKFVLDGETSYAFNYVEVDEEDGIIGFISSSLSADDLVVLTEV